MTDLNSSDIPSVSSVGGKGLNLVRLTRAGMSIPKGFIIEARHFDEYTNELKDLRRGDAEPKELSTILTRKINDIVFQKDFIADIVDSFKKLGSRYVAVRSSAVSEDGENASWAGQLSTELNVQQDDLEQAIKKCWASAYSPRALTYALENNCALSDISVAVVIQEMIESDVSGVAFSVHPVTNNIQEMVIEAVYGLGEAIVSGAVTPDEYVVKKNDLSIVDTTAARQDKKISLHDGVTDWVPVPAQLSKQQKLNTDEITEVASALKLIEQKMGYPADVEWALKDRKLYITQSRPITTLKIDIMKEGK
ncbi:hypothetical protein KA021_02455 [Candidatus Saccharibacteria bacterium]|jgi:pyruvate,water dikinase|nr:hypothetical protein [Candidatus Saccharibacteria bacterium]